MTCYAIGLLRNVEMSAEIRSYLERIDATLAPFDGRFIIHGGAKHPLEGRADDDLIVIEFPDIEAARAWYGSAAYRAIIDLRLSRSDGVVYLIEGVDADHRATDILAA